MAGDAPTAQDGTDVATQNAATNGAAPADRAKLTRAEQDAADRAAFVAASFEDEPAAKQEPKKPAPKAAEVELESLDEAVAEDEADLELEGALDDDLDGAGDDATSEDHDESDDASPTKGEPEAAKRFGAVRKLEKRVREQAEARDRAFAAERNAFIAEWKPKIAEYEKFEQLRSRKTDVAGTLHALGYSDDDFEQLSQILYGLSKAGAADPKYRDHAKRLVRDRELFEESAGARREAAAVRTMLEQRDAQAEADRKVDAYRERILKTAGDETPLLRKRLSSAPKATRAAIDKVALELAQTTGALVDPKRVARVYEQRLRATIERAKQLAGDDATDAATKPDVKAAKVAKPKPAIAVIDKTKAPGAKEPPAPKNGVNGSGSAIPSREDMLERLRKIDRGELDPDTD